MGANAHVAIEYRPTWNNKSKSKEWYVWAMNVAEARDYILYALLAKVRGEYKYSYTPRGFPKDVSPETKTWLSEAADHSYTWLTPVEFYKAHAHYDQAVKADGYDDSDLYQLSSEWDAIAEVLLVLSKHFGVKNVRIVLGFDS